MLKRALVMILLVGGLTLCSTDEAQAWRRHRRYVVHRPVVVAPVRRVAYGTVVRPYPVARRVVVARPYVPVYPAYPIVYGPGVSVYIGY
jgi:hypothetical protein